MKKIGNRKSEIGNLRAFTLVELLTVIAIIGILAGMLLTVLPRVKISAQKMKAKKEMSEIVTAIQGYDADYGRFPVSTSANGNPNAQSAAGNGDFTYGGTFQTPTGPLVLGTAGYQVTNSEVIAILMDITNYPSGAATIDNGHQKNPKQVKYLTAKMSGDTASSGVGTDLVYRDPWGNPYVITLDLNYDESCWDLFYETPTVSANGGQGLILQKDPSNNPVYAFHGKIMVWSAGPDKKIDPLSVANQGANKDNVLSWQ